MDGVAAWESRWQPFERDESLEIPPERARAALAELIERLEDNYPFFHPDYAGQMLRPPHPVALAAYAAAARINPNNHALDGGPATAKLELEVVAQLATMFGYGPGHLGHLTSSGTIGNLEALWVASRLKPGTKIAFSTEAHYTHARMCELLGVETVTLAVDRRGRIDMDALRALGASRNVGTIVVTAGTTAAGAVDPIHEIAELACERGWRVHADAAYGGFFAIVAGDPQAKMDPAPWRALKDCDSIVVDPHKHGLQPYGCGCVLFADERVAELYRHESPYTYYIESPRSAEARRSNSSLRSSRSAKADRSMIHLGEISLECSRAGAAAAALWTTLRCFPLDSSGLGGSLLASRQAALAAYDCAIAGERITPIVAPELDIIALLAAAPGEPISAAAASRRAEAIFELCESDARAPLYLAKWHLPEAFGRLALPNVTWDAPSCTVLRSVLMKPEQRQRAPALVARIEKAMNGL